MAPVPVVVILDGDNTLWDTDAVFRAAQLAMLRSLGEAGVVPDHATRLELLRELDMELARQLGRFEYDFRLLAGAVGRRFAHGLTAAEAARRVVAPDERDEAFRDDLVEDAHRAFEAELARVPPLLPGADDLLVALRRRADADGSVATVLYSEGKPERVGRILDAHRLRARRLLDEVVLEPKSVEGFERAKALGRRHLRRPEADGGRDAAVAFVAVGDSLARDVVPANLAGCVTVYRPSPFKGAETPRAAHERPAFAIDGLGEVAAVLALVRAAGGAEG